jgi:hypothetical protein
MGTCAMLLITIPPDRPTGGRAQLSELAARASGCAPGALHAACLVYAVRCMPGVRCVVLPRARRTLCEKCRAVCCRVPCGRLAARRLPSHRAPVCMCVHARARVGACLCVWVVGVCVVCAYVFARACACVRACVRAYTRALCARAACVRARAYSVGELMLA